MKIEKLIINTKTQKYPIIIGRNLIAKLSRFTSNTIGKHKKYLLIIDKNVPKKNINKIKKSFKNFQTNFYYFEANEKNKNFKIVNIILNILLKENYSRQDCVIAIGGGITGDVSAYAASIFKRGLKFINVPTTLLSQVDSSIGGKTGVNTKFGKNLVGSFYQPQLVLSDIDFLETLPRRELICGYGEILKHSLIANKRFFKFLNTNFLKIINLQKPLIEKAIYESCKIKKEIVEKDEKEKNLRKTLNFGHTFAHAYEATLGYSRKLNHGEAVILGICTALRFSVENNFLSHNEYQSIIKHISIANLPQNINRYFKLNNLNKILSFMSKDKKNKSNKINLILLRKIGQIIIDKEFTKLNLKSFLKRELTN
tara:strand:- start:11049 stop:12155 length:1107 start_codon:yes stop_codon:yes gene_type:complete